MNTRPGLVFNEPPRILVVDDTPENLEIVGRTLEESHFDVYVAHSGQTALELLGKVSVDLVLLDVMMPEMDGFETCQAIKSDPAQRDTPVIFMTAKVDVESVIRGFKLGAADYIRKPFNLLELLARVQTQIELRQLRLRIEHEASTDLLTGLLNQREILRRIDYEATRAARSGSSFSLLLTKITHVHEIKGRLGRTASDAMLQSAASLFQSSIRLMDSLARWSDDAFLFLLPDTDETGAEVLAASLRAHFADSRIAVDGNQDEAPTLSTGVVRYRPSTTVLDLLAEAEENRKA